MANRNPFGLNSECVNYYNTDQSLIHITEDKLRVIQANILGMSYIKNDSGYGTK